ncbi:MAG: ABC transporter ATP-binding protein [Actinomycetota bacterium]|nr:ABC transporter ATP-binding protein [Actinomycetota bacterium]
MNLALLHDPAPDRSCTPAVQVQGLTKSYAGRVVVDDLDLTVYAGEVLGLIGANGAGKTTTVECLQGLRRADEGTIRVLGLDPVKDADRLRPRIGSQLQDSALPDRLRVGEAVALFATGRARGGDELLERFGLGSKRRSPFAGLSGGERQRLFLVLALLNRPELVILDELTQGLDPVARREVWGAVATLRDEGTTVLLVTHELLEAEVLCERVVAMRSGAVLDTGTPAELVARHAGWATVRFGVDLQPGALEGLDRLPGVRDVRVEGAGRDCMSQVAVHGDRQIIAQVGAWLVPRGPVPTDLRVEVPDLEAAVLALLDGDTAAGPTPTSPSPIGEPA